MTYRQRMLAVLKGEESDRIPFCPRMDLWYIANQARGALPDRFGGMTAESALCAFRALYDSGCFSLTAVV
jgi:hypothetical protein